MVKRKKLDVTTKTTQSKTPLPTRLYRSETNRIVSGVAGGIAEYTNIDPTIVRVLFALLTLFGGSGIVLYLILWVVVPTESSAGRERIHVQKDSEKMRIKTKNADSIIDDRRTNRSLWAILLIIFGAIFLLRSAGFYDIDLGKWWPILLIVGGILLLRRH